MIRPCSEVPAYNTPSGASCVQNLAEKFAFVKLLGSGEQGVAFEVVHEQQKMVVKVIPMGLSGLNEIETQCILNQLQSKTGIFTKSFGWQVCSEIPSPWAEYVAFDTTERILFIFMEKAMETIESVPMKRKEKKAVLFLLLHGLMIARRDLNGFKHDDIHKENVMLQSIEYNSVVHLDDGYTVGPHLRFVPKLIDYGFSKVKYEYEDSDSEEDSEENRPTTDLSSIQILFENNGFEAFFASPEFQAARTSLYTDYRAIKVLLDMDFFKEYHDNEDRASIRCSVCSASPLTSRHLYYSWSKCDPNFTFCSIACGNVWRRGIGAFMSLK